MANADAAFGFRPINRDGSPYSGGAMRGVFDSGEGSATFIGDAVKLAGSSIEGYPTLEQCNNQDPVFGVVVAFEVDPDSLSDQYRKASTQRFCQYVSVDNTYFEIQSDGDGGDLSVDSVGLNADYVIAAGSTQYGLSGMQLNTDTANTTASLDLQIVSIVDRADNALGTTNQNVIVKFNDPQSKALRLGV